MLLVVVVIILVEIKIASILGVKEVIENFFLEG